MRQPYDPVQGNTGALFPGGGSGGRGGKRLPLPGEDQNLGLAAPGGFERNPNKGSGPLLQIPPGIDPGQILGRPTQPGGMGMPGAPMMEPQVPQTPQMPLMGGGTPPSGAPSARDLIMAELQKRIGQGGR